MNILDSKLNLIQTPKPALPAQTQGSFIQDEGCIFFKLQF